MHSKKSCRALTKIQGDRLEGTSQHLEYRCVLNRRAWISTGDWSANSCAIPLRFWRTYGCVESHLWATSMALDTLAYGRWDETSFEVVTGREPRPLVPQTAWRPNIYGLFMVWATKRIGGYRIESGSLRAWDIQGDFRATIRDGIEIDGHGSPLCSPLDHFNRRIRHLPYASRSSGVILEEATASRAASS